MIMGIVHQVQAICHILKRITSHTKKYQPSSTQHKLKKVWVLYRSPLSLLEADVRNWIAESTHGLQNMLLHTTPFGHLIGKREIESRAGFVRLSQHNAFLCSRLCCGWLRFMHERVTEPFAVLSIFLIKENYLPPQDVNGCLERGHGQLKVIPGTACQRESIWNGNM